MGIFNNEYRIVVGVSTQQLVKGKYAELRDTVLDSIINDRNTAQNIKNTLTNGFRASVFAYQRTLEGLPDNQGFRAIYNYEGGFDAKTSIFPPLDGVPILGRYGDRRKLILDSQEALDLSRQYKPDMVYVTYQWQNCYDPVWYLEKEYMPNVMGWNPADDSVAVIPIELSIQAGKPVQSIKWRGESELFTWGPAVYFDVTYQDGTTAAKQLYQIPLGEPETEWIETNKDFLVFLYANEDQVYIPTSSLNEKMKRSVEKVKEGLDGKYLVASSIRNTKVNLVETPDNDYKRLVTRALDKLGVDIKSVTDQIMSTEGGNDPEIIDDAFIGFGVNVRTDNEICIKYMFDFFSTTIDWFGSETEQGWINRLNELRESIKLVTLRDLFIQVSLGGGENDNYSHQIRYTWAERTITTGVIGPVGKTTKTIVARPVINEGSDTIDNHVLELRRQVNTTEYVTIRVCGLQFVGQTYPGAYCYYRLSEYEDDAKNHIHFPIILSIINNYGTFEQGEVLKEALMLTIFAKDVVKIPWYLREEFLKAVQVAIIVYSIVTFNPQGATYMEILKQLALDAIKQIIVAKIIGELLKQAVDIFGEKDTQILVAIAIIYGAYEFSFGDAAWAENLLKDTLLAQNALNNIVQDNYNDVVEQIKELQVQYKEAMEEIEKINDEFAPDISHLFARRFVFQINPNEEPEQFFNRTVHNSNIGVASLDYPSSYVDVMLKLPEYEFIKRGV